MAMSSSVSSSSPSSSSSWLREASLRRLNNNLLNQKEFFISSLELSSSIRINEIETSGLNPSEIKSLQHWINGEMSGRQCLLSLLENYYEQTLMSTSSQQPQQASTIDLINKSEDEYLMTGSKAKEIHFEILRKSINLPQYFLCDSGYLLEQIFSKQPNVVLKEALQLLSQYSLETTSSTLSSDQINLAIKQMKLMNLSSSSSSSTSQPNDITTSSSPSPPHPHTTLLRSRVESYRSQILIELLRNHIQKVTTTTTSPSLASPSFASPSFASHDDLRNYNKEENDDDDDDQEEDFLGDSKKDPKIASLPNLNQLISQNLHLTSNEILSQTEKISSNKQLETENKLLQPYITQLLQLKTQLTSQMTQLTESKAFYSLGLSPPLPPSHNSHSHSHPHHTSTSSSSAGEGAAGGAGGGGEVTLSDLKKAYHRQAIKCHPDKPTGNKEKFQQLAQLYSECLEKLQKNNQNKIQILNGNIFDHIKNSKFCLESSRQELTEIQKILNQLTNHCLPVLVENSNQLISLVHRNLHWKKFLEYQIKESLNSSSSSSFPSSSASRSHDPASASASLSSNFVGNRLIQIFEACQTQLPVDYLGDGNGNGNGKKKSNKKKKKSSSSSSSLSGATTLENSSCALALPLLEKIVREANEFISHGMQIFQSSNGGGGGGEGTTTAGGGGGHASLYRVKFAQDLSLMKSIESIAKFGLEIQQNISISLLLSPEKQLTFYLEQIEDYLHTIRDWQESRLRVQQTYEQRGSLGGGGERGEGDEIDVMMFDVMNRQCERYLENLNTIFQTKYLKLQMMIDNIVQLVTTAVDFISQFQKRFYEITEKYLQEILQQETAAAAAAEERDEDGREGRGGGRGGGGGIDELDEEDLKDLYEKMNEKQKRQQEEKERNEEALQKAKREGKEMEYLEKQIRGLHVQLRSQYFETIQGLNSEIRLLQQNIFQSIQHSLHEELTENSSAPLAPVPTPPPPVPSPAPVPAPVPPPAPAPAPKNGTTESLLTLLAEVIDHSCLTLREKIRERTNREMKMTPEEFEKILRDSLGWMRRLVTIRYETPVDHEKEKEEEKETTKEEEKESVSVSKARSLHEIDIDFDEEEGEGEGVEKREGEDKGKEMKEISDPLPSRSPLSTSPSSSPSSSSKGPIKKMSRLALIPEIKSKILCVAVMVDEKNVKEIVGRELFQRLQKDCSQQLQNESNGTLFMNQLQFYCEEIVDEVEAISREQQQQQQQEKENKEEERKKTAAAATGGT